MDITLCMVVKDEENRIARCLEPLQGLIAAAVIVDTGSTDRTREILRDRFRIEPISIPLAQDRPFSVTAQRNEAYARARTSWILCLDADERIAREGAGRLARMADDASVHGYFLPWITDTGEGEPIEDYKLSLFRRGTKKLGLIHETVQPDFRARDLSAEWFDGAVIEHAPEVVKLLAKEDRYRDALVAAVRADPEWRRYHWFLGHHYMRRGDFASARAYHAQGFEARSPRFPVECLNSAMELAWLDAREGKRDSALATLDRALAHHSRVADDWEVKVNFRLRPWLESALANAQAGRLEKIVPYRFPY